MDTLNQRVPAIAYCVKVVLSMAVIILVMVKLYNPRQVMVRLKTSRVLHIKVRFIKVLNSGWIKRN